MTNRSTDLLTDRHIYVGRPTKIHIKSGTDEQMARQMNRWQIIGDMDGKKDWQKKSIPIFLFLREGSCFLIQSIHIIWGEGGLRKQELLKDTRFENVPYLKIRYSKLIIFNNLSMSVYPSIIATRLSVCLSVWVYISRLSVHLFWDTSVKLCVSLSLHI